MHYNKEYFESLFQNHVMKIPINNNFNTFNKIIDKNEIMKIPIDEGFSINKNQIMKISIIKAIERNENMKNSTNKIINENNFNKIINKYENIKIQLKYFNKVYNKNEIIKIPIIIYFDSTNNQCSYLIEALNLESTKLPSKIY